MTNHTNARAGALTAIIMCALIAGIHLHDSWLADTPLRWISGPLSYFARYYSSAWEAGVLIAAAILVFFTVREAVRLAASIHNSSES